MSVLVEFPIEEAEGVLAARDLLVAIGFPGGSNAIAGFGRLEQAIRVEQLPGGSEKGRCEHCQDAQILFGGAVFEAVKAS